MKTFGLLVIGGVLAVIASSCVTNEPLPPRLRTEAHSADGVKILSVGLSRDSRGLLVHGTVERQVGYFDSPLLHLDIEVRGPAGELITNRPTNFFPNPIPYSRFGTGRATYSARLETLPPPNSTIRVSVSGGAAKM